MTTVDPAGEARMTDQTTTSITAIHATVSCNVTGCTGGCGICQPTPTVEGSGRTEVVGDYPAKASDAELIVRLEEVAEDRERESRHPGLIAVEQWEAGRDALAIREACRRLTDRVPSPTAARGVTGLPALERLAEIEAMLDRLSPWPWTPDTTVPHDMVVWQRNDSGDEKADKLVMNIGDPFVRVGDICGLEADCRFIAAAPSLVRELIEQVRTLLSAAEQTGNAGYVRALRAHLDAALDALAERDPIAAAMFRAGTPTPEQHVDPAAEQGERDREASRRLAMLALQSRRYGEDVEYREAVDAVLAYTQNDAGRPPLTITRGSFPGGSL